MTEKITINRKDFVERLMRQCDMTFPEASAAFECFCDILKDGVVNGAKIRFGKLGALRPTWHAPKAVHMGFKVSKKGTLTKNKHVYFMGKRLRYTLKIYDKFIDNHELHWYDEDWPIDEEQDQPR